MTGANAMHTSVGPPDRLSQLRSSRLLWRATAVVTITVMPWAEIRSEVMGPRAQPAARRPAERHPIGSDGSGLGTGLRSGLRTKVAQRPSHPNTYQDGLVVHAGGAYAGQVDSLEGHGRHGHAACRGGQCGDHCVVTPDRFGFYGTRWRTWPGTKVVQTAGTEELTPAAPPAMELPSAGQESRDPEAPVDFGVDEPFEDPGAVTLPGLGPAVPSRPEAPPEARPRPQPVPDRPIPEPPIPEPKKPVPPAAQEPEENLFDEAARGRRLNERLAMVHARAKPREQEDAPIRFPGAEGARPIDRGTRSNELRRAGRVWPTAGRSEATATDSTAAEPSATSPRRNPLRR